MLRENNMESSSSVNDQHWDALQRANIARTYKERRAWRKNFMLLLVLVVITVAGATALARLGRPHDSMGRPEEGRSGWVTTRLNGGRVTRPRGQGTSSWRIRWARLVPGLRAELDLLHLAR
jgi:hypothetical protein